MTQRIDVTVREAAEGKNLGHATGVELGPRGAKGDKGDKGEPGESLSYVHDQLSAVTVWGPIVHNLGKRPVFLVEDSAGTLVLGGDPEYLDENTMTITFGIPFGGTAYLS